MKANAWVYIIAGLASALLLAVVWHGTLVSREARASTAVSAGGLMAIAATGGDENVLFLVDPAERKVAVYEVFSGSNPFRLIAVRNIRFDFLPDDFNDRMGITVEEIRKAYGDKPASR